MAAHRRLAHVEQRPGGVGIDAEHAQPQDARQQPDIRPRRPLAPERRVPGGDMAHLVPDHAGELRLVPGQPDQAAGDVDIAAGGGEGVDGRAVEDGEGPALAPLPADAGEAPPDPVHIVGELRVPVLAAEPGDDLRVRPVAGALLGGGARRHRPRGRPRPRLRRRLRACLRGRGRSGGLVGLAAGQRDEPEHQQRSSDPSVEPHASLLSRSTGRD